ncbi:MAG TPA: hypothetical protein PLF31_01465 [Candidatus Paceibacterota bacterium]|nr:hypothetical protein [Candidatus Paceibacterota bacterium]
MFFRLIPAVLILTLLFSPNASAAVRITPVGWDVQVYTPDNDPAYAIFHGTFTVENETQDDLLIKMSTLFTNGMNPGGLSFSINHVYGNSVEGVYTPVFTSTNEDAGWTKILEGTTEQFFVWVHFQPTYNGILRMQLNGLTYMSIQSNTLTATLLYPPEDWWSPSVYVPGTNIPEPGTLATLFILGSLGTRTRRAK